MELFSITINNMEYYIPPIKDFYSADEAYSLMNSNDLNEIQRYLYITDWTVIRSIESGTSMPEHILNNRRLVRSKIQELQDTRKTNIQEI